jgi:hypothetical protein
LEASSDDRRGTIASAVLLLVLAALCGSIELACRFAIPKISHIEGRVQNEYQAILRPSIDSTHGVRVAVLGNSLLGAGIRFDEAQRQLAPEIDVQRLLIEDTWYLDWKYGMRRLFSEGSRPDVVVLVMTARQLVSSRTRGDYFAYHLMNWGDLLAVSNDISASNTQVSDMAFGRLSAFGGIRAELRKLAVGSLVPDLPHLMSLMTGGNAQPLDAASVRELSERRLAELKRLAAGYRAKFVLVIPPEGTKAAETMASVVQAAGARAGVSVLVPVTPGSLPANLFADGFHLNEQGAKVFTPRFVESLRAAINIKLAGGTASTAVETSRGAQTGAARWGKIAQ